MTPLRSKPERTITAPRGVRDLRLGRLGASLPVTPPDPNQVRPAARDEIYQVVMGAVLLGFLALILCFSHG